MAEQLSRVDTLDGADIHVDGRRLLAERVEALYSTSRFILPFNVVLGSILVVAIWDMASHLRLTIWLLALTIAAAARLGLARMYVRTPAARTPEGWLRLFITGAAANGLVWGMSVPALVVEHTVTSLWFTSLWPCGIATGAVAAYAMVPLAFVALVTPMLLPGIVYLLADPAREIVILGAGVAVYFAFLLMLVHLISRNSVRRLVLEIANRELVGSMRRKNEEIQGFNATLEERVRQRTEALRKSEAKLRDFAFNDHLTGLASRTAVMVRLEEVCSRAESTFSIILFDIGGIDAINSALGHEAVDEILRTIAKRASVLCNDNILLARLGASVFCAVCDPEMSRGHVRELARRIVRLGQQPVEFNGLSLEARTHAGVAHFPDHSTDPNDLLINASAAKRVAHGSSSGYMEYEVEHAVRVERFTLASDLKRAIDEDQLILHYQPKLHLETNEICSAEALMRWNHPTRGMVPPGEFIGLAEQTGLISRLTYWAVAEALRQTEEWRRQGLSIGVSINVSAKDLSRPDFFSVVRRSLLENKTPYEGCMLEVTESTMMRNPEANIDILTQLRAIGVHSSIDDFGTGYSSLAYLTRMPVAELKIDRAFVGDMLTNKQNALIVSSTISLAHALGLAVTAEGVEDAQTGEALKDLGCDIVQGYGISRPVDAEAFCKWCRARAQAL